MPEEKSFMQRLDEWTDSTVIMPLADPKAEENFDAVVDRVKTAIRAKVLESYRNGQAAGPQATRPAGKEPRHAQAKTR